MSLARRFKRVLELGLDQTKPGGDLFDFLVRVSDGTEEVTTGTGTVNGTGVTAVELAGRVRSATLTLVNTPVVMVDEAGVVAYGSLKLYDLPEGAIVFLGGTTDLALTLSAAGIDADWNGDVSLGTAAASNNATLTGTEANIIPSTATPEAVTSATTANAETTSTESSAVADGTTTAVDVYLNLVVDDVDHDITSTPTNIIANGTITVLYANLGDN